MSRPVRADALPVGRRATFGFRLARAILAPLVRLVFDVRIEGRQHIPKPGPYVVIGNHLNWPDGWLLLLAFPTEPRLHFLANPTNLIQHRFDWWVIRSIGGYIPVYPDRHQGLELFRHVNLALAKGAALAIFPEAAYGPEEGRLQSVWKSGFAHFAVESGLPVVPVALSGTKDLWLRKRLGVRIGEPIPAGQDVDELSKLSRRRLEELLPPYREPAGRKPLRRFLTRLLY